MSTEAIPSAEALGTYERLRYGREVLRVEGEALLALSRTLSQSFNDAIELLYHCRGSVIVIGMGKAGLVGQKLVATLASTGTPSHFLHPGEAVHGDLGRVQSGDVALVLSFSGETDEVVRLLPSLARMQVPLVAITGRATSSLGQQARVVLDLGPLQEACWMGLAPTTSTTAMMALGDAVALVLSRMRRFAADDFARYHPAGSLGRKLAKVEDVMRPLTECRLAPQDKTVRQVLIEVSKPGRRTGAIMLLDGEGRLQGIFTDSDLARLLERNRDADIDGPVSQVMTRRPKTITCGASLSQAVRVFIDSKISELPVIDEAGRPQGLVDVTDIVGMLPQDDVGTDPASPPHLPAIVRPLTVVFPRSDGETSGDET